MFWVNSYAAGVSLNGVSDAFATAQEFIDKYGSLTNEEFVSQMYVNVYGRQPDMVGLAYWTDLLDTSALTRGEVMVFFSIAKEYLSISANQVYVTMTYMGLLRRAPDLGGFEFWVDWPLAPQQRSGFGCAARHCRRYALPPCPPQKLRLHSHALQSASQV